MIDTPIHLWYAATMGIAKKEAIVYGWEQTKNQLWVVVGTFTASIALPGFIQRIAGVDEMGQPHPLLSLLSFLLSILISIGITRFSLNIIHKKPVSVTLLYSEYRHFFQMLLATILNALAVGLSLLLLLIPGIIVGVKLSMFKYFLIEKDMNAIDALKASWELTNGHVWELFLFALLRLGVIVLGLLALGVGVLVAIPVAEIAKAKVYTQLHAHKS